MLLVSHKLQLLHIHVPKTGGTTINSVLRDWDKNAKPLTRRAHEPAAFVAEAYPDEFENYIKIASVRNPWARAVSLYNYRRASLETRQHENWPPHWPSQNEVAGMDFLQFLQKGASESECEICPPRDANRTVWLEPSCSAWLSIEGQICVDRVLRTETLDDDLRALCKDLGAPSSQIPHLNKTTNRSYQSYYNDQTRAFIAERYRADVSTFGYAFDEL